MYLPGSLAPGSHGSWLLVPGSLAPGSLAPGSWLLASSLALWLLAASSWLLGSWLFWPVVYRLEVSYSKRSSSMSAHVKQDLLAFNLELRPGVGHPELSPSRIYQLMPRNLDILALSCCYREKRGIRILPPTLRIQVDFHGAQRASSSSSTSARAGSPPGRASVLPPTGPGACNPPAPLVTEVLQQALVAPGSLASGSWLRFLVPGS